MTEKFLRHVASAADAPTSYQVRLRMNHLLMPLVLIVALGIFIGCTTKSSVEVREPLPKTVVTSTVDGVMVYGERYYGDLDSSAPTSSRGSTT